MSGDRWVNLLYLLPILLISLMVHELAHGWIAYRLGDPTAKNRGRLSFNPVRHLDMVGTAMFIITYLFSGFVFGWAKPIPVSPYYFRNRQRGMAIVGAAGPACNFLMAVVFGLILRFTYPPLTAHFSQIDKVILDILFMFVQINIVLGVFNLIPIPPLDGSRVLGGFLPRSAYEKWVSVDRYGMLILLVLIVAFSRPFFDALSGAVTGIRDLILWGLL
jgi:Zn-dependent protease